MNVQRNFESLQTQLAGTQCELDKAVAQVEQLQRLQKSHVFVDISQ